MQFYALLNFQHWVLAFFLGVISVIVVYVGWRGYETRRFQDLDVTDAGKSVDPQGSEHNPVLPVQILVYIGTAIWMIAYAILVGVIGGPII